MAKMIQIPYEYNITVPVRTAQAVQQNNENPISLQALGLLVNLLSYPTTWELHKTELYKRYKKNKEEAVKSAWNDLMAANYIIEFKYRVGKKWEYVYYFRKVPFSTEERDEILDNAKKEYGEIWGLDFQVPKMETRKPGDNKKTLLNKKTISNTNKLYKENIDDIRTHSEIHNNESIDSIINNLREQTKDELSDRSFKSVVRKVVDKYNQGQIGNFREYLVSALNRKIEELEFRRQKDKAKQNIFQSKKIEVFNAKLSNGRPVPFYNWLEQ
ncbi:hypothetical protein [Mesobacillus zeae]|uniref:hypothetical protein n=1 Tax=Mesobacillus zeae TaxID=1917180 RepID=UPI00300B4006